MYFHNGGNRTNNKGGLIAGANNGVSAGGGAATVTNAGSITSATNNGVYLNSGSVNNQAGGVIAGKTDGVYNRNFAIAVTNSGLIETTGTLNGIYLRGGGNITNNAGATIAGSAAGVALGQHGGAVTNHGVIKGVIGFNGGMYHSGGNTLVNYGTLASTSTVAVEMGNSLGSKLLVVETGAVFTGLVEGGGRGEIEFAATGTAAMTGNISGFDTVALANGGADTLTLAQANFTGVSGNRITVIGGNAGNTVNASAVTTGRVTIEGGAGTDVLTGDAGNSAIFVFTNANLAATDKVTGSGANNELDVTTPGTVAVAGVTAIQIYRLANGGANTLTLTNANFTGVTARPINVYVGTGGNTIDGSALSAGNNLDIYGGAGTDVLKGGAGNDIFSFAATNLTATDTVSGGTGSDLLNMTTAGTVAAAKVSGVETYVLADGAANTLTLTSANFTGVNGSTITVSDGNSGHGQRLRRSSAGSRRRLRQRRRRCADRRPRKRRVLCRRQDDDDRRRRNQRICLQCRRQQHDRRLHGIAEQCDLVQQRGFALGLSGATGTPKPLPASLFTANATGAFTATTQRFAYDTSNGNLFYSASGTTPTEHLVATLTGHPTLAASHLFFIS